MKPNFEEMSKAELKAYVLSHRDDDEAIRVFFGRRNPPDSEATWYGPMCTPEGVTIEENIRIAEQAIKKRVEIAWEKQKQREKEIEARLLPKITGENQQFAHPTTATVTAEEIEQFREQLKHNPEALAALDTIQECEGNLEEAARSIATAAGNTDLESDLLEELSTRCRTVICQEDMKEKLPVLIAAIAEFLALSSGFPSRLATPIALFAIDKGSEDFCDF